MNNITMIVAMDLERGIGSRGSLPWRLKGDLQFFKQMTVGNTVVMGRKTWESLPPRFRPLPDRKNVVLSRSQHYSSGVDCFSSVDRIRYGAHTGRIFVIGGGDVYRAFLDLASNILITRVMSSFSCDVFFPAYTHLFECVSISDEHAENGIKYRFEEWVRCYPLDTLADG